MDNLATKKTRLPCRHLVALTLLMLSSMASSWGESVSPRQSQPSPNQVLPGHAIEPPEPAPSPMPTQAVDEMELITFGTTKPQIPTSQRLSELELTVFKQVFPQLSDHLRVQKLQETLLGSSIGSDSLPQEQPLQQSSAQQGHGTRPLTQEPAYLVELPRQELEQFACELVNEERVQLGLVPLTWDTLAYKVARNHVEDLGKQDVVSHFSSTGANPDHRYTQLEGADALSEG
ncbi:MAG: hypothetical protein HY711_10760, partial [Candidatus Melainabacteria bacterium]|nr:hypothetical protein [Candidatus Melainabacteria bacterium]